MIRFFDEDDEGMSTRAQDMLGVTPEVMVDRRVIREYLDKRRRYWLSADRVTANTGAVATEIITLLAERYGIKVCDSDWS